MEIRKANQKVVVASMDVVGLYPNLNIKRTAEECGKEAEETEVEFEKVGLVKP